MLRQFKAGTMPVLESVRREWRPILSLALPLILAELGWMAMGIVDTIMVGRLPASAVAIGAVSLGSILFYTGAIFAGAMLFGLDTVGASLRRAQAGRLPPRAVERTASVRFPGARSDWGQRRRGRRIAALRRERGRGACRRQLHSHPKLGRRAAAAVFRRAALLAGHGAGQAGDVRAALGQPCQPVRQLAAHLRPPGFSRNGHGWIRVGHRGGGAPATLARPCCATWRSTGLLGCRSATCCASTPAGPCSACGADSRSGSS
jgi:hypothetical protein